MKRHVALIGFMAAGKSTIGKRLARKLGVAFYDSDELVVREHGAISEGDVVRGSNRAGGIEGGMSNGQRITLLASVKPIPTLMRALPSVDLHAGTAAPASIVRSDVCVVPAAAIVGEAMLRLALVEPLLEKYGGDSMEETLDNLSHSRARAAQLFAKEQV